jgi:hypothetical protein
MTHTIFDAIIREGDDLFFEILKDYPELDEDDYRRETLLVTLLTNCIVHLHEYGWSEKALNEEVNKYCKISREIFHKGEDEE